MLLGEKESKYIFFSFSLFQYNCDSVPYPIQNFSDVSTVKICHDYLLIIISKV